MATQTNTTGTVTLNAGFTEIITSGVIVPQNLPTATNQSITYANGTTLLSTDLIYGKALTLSAAATTLDFTSVLDLSGTSQSFARIRELVIQNLGSAL